MNAQTLTEHSFHGLGFRIAHAVQRPTYFAFGVRKSGSSIMNSMINRLADLNSINYVDFPGRLFEAGVPVEQWDNDPRLLDLLLPGNLYGGYRACPRIFEGASTIRPALSVLMVRDPRDALVSEYFSNAYSHSIPPQGEGRDAMMENRRQAQRSEVNAYVLERAADLKRTVSAFRWLNGEPNCWVVRYEDVIPHKDRFLRELCSRWQWQVSEQHIGEIMHWADVQPTEERPLQFIRKVTPGDHREKLSSQTIARLNEIFSEELSLYRYSA